MKKPTNEIKKNLHDLSNALHNAYETLENVELFMGSDPDFCAKALKAVREERGQAFESISQLRRKLQEIGIYE